MLEEASCLQFLCSSVAIRFLECSFSDIKYGEIIENCYYCDWALYSSCLLSAVICRVFLSIDFSQ